MTHPKTGEGCQRKNLASGSLLRSARNLREIKSANGLMKPGNLLKAAKMARFYV